MQPYIPQPLPIKDLDWGRLLGIVGRANAELARYDGLLQGIVNPAVLLSPLTTHEAVYSSKIEGTQATLDEVLEHEAGLALGDEKEKDIQEVVNYRKALMTAREAVSERPITLSVVQRMHELLMDSVRGFNKFPGQFRNVQNYIGMPGTSIDQAIFVPPTPLQLMESLKAWERYIHTDDIDPLIQTAVIHAQFELLHPFNDGNGRIGRLLVPLFLYQRKCISAPMFYLSSYLEEHRTLYYASLRTISQERNWTTWITFFLNAVQHQARQNAAKVRRIMHLYTDMKKQIVEITHSQYSLTALDELFSFPIFRTSDFISHTGIPKQSAMPLLRQIKEAGYLKTIREAGGRTPAVLAFPALLNIAEGKDVL